MADDSDNKVVIEVDADTTPFQKKVDALNTDIASKNTSNTDNKSNDPFKDSFDFKKKSGSEHNATGNSEDSAPDSGAAALRKVADILRGGAVGAGTGAAAGAAEAGGAGAHGADALTDKLKNVGEAGEGSLKKIKSALTDAFTAVGQGDFFSSFTHGAEGAEHAAEKVREGIHVLHPVLEEAGISMGNLGAFARLAGAGFGVLATAVGGTVLVALAKVGEQTERTASRLKSLTGSDKASSDLKSRAEELGTSPNDLAPIVEQEQSFAQRRVAENNVRGGIITAPGFNNNAEAQANAEKAAAVNILGPGRPNQPGNILTAKDLGQFSDTLLQAARLNQTPPDKARAGVSEFEKSTFATGKVTGDDLQKLSDATAPSITKAIVDALSQPTGKGGLGRSFQNLEEVKAAPEVKNGQLTIDQVVAAVNKISPDIKAKADALPPGITESLEHLKTAAEKLTEQFGKDVGLAGVVEKLSKAINAEAEKIDKNLHPEDYKPGGSKYKAGDEAAPEQHNTKSFGDALGGVFGSGDDHGDALGRLTNYLTHQIVPAIAKGPEALHPELPALEGLDKIKGDLKAAASQPGASSQQQSPFVEETNRSAKSAQEPSSPIQYDRELSSSPYHFLTQPPPLEQPQANGPRSEAAPQPEQTSGLASVISALTAAITSLGSKQNLEQTGPSSNLGIRGEAQPQDAAAANQVAALGNAAAQAKAQLEQLASVRAPEQTTTASPPVTAAEGGHIRGPGTSTSDSIPAMLSDGEYVMRTEAVKRIGVENLDAVNNGSAHLSAGGEVHRYADGGSVVGNEKKTLSDLGEGHHQVTYNRDTGGANIDGVEYPRDSQLLQDPEIQRLLQESKKGDDSKPTKHHKSDFVGTFGGDAQNHFAGGGEVTDAADIDPLTGKKKKKKKKDGSEAVEQQPKEGGLTEAVPGGGDPAVIASLNEYSQAEGQSDPNFIPITLTNDYASGGRVKFASGGLVGSAPRAPSVFQHFNLGGLATRIARSTAPVIGYASGGVARSAPSAAPDAMEHWGTVDLRHESGDFKVATERDTMRHLNANAQRAKRFTTGNKPSWYGSSGR